ncbi:hypothetical protein B7463_g12272, partial [Scytalidium lignicola]
MNPEEAEPQTGPRRRGGLTATVGGAQKTGQPRRSFRVQPGAGVDACRKGKRVVKWPSTDVLKRQCSRVNVAAVGGLFALLDPSSNQQQQQLGSTPRYGNGNTRHSQLKAAPCPERRSETASHSSCNPEWRSLLMYGGRQPSKPLNLPNSRMVIWTVCLCWRETQIGGGRGREQNAQEQDALDGGCNLKSET